METDVQAELDRLEETHGDEVAQEARRGVRHAPRPLRVLRPSSTPASDAARARLGAPALFPDPLRSSGPWLATVDDEPLCVVDVSAPFGGHAPLLLVRGYMEGDFGATMLGHGLGEATEALRRSLRALLPSLPHLELAACAADARADVAARLRARRPGRILVVGETEDVDSLGPHRVLPAPPPRLDGVADDLDAAALAAFEHALTEEPAAALWIVALDAAGRAVSEPLMQSLVARARSGGIPIVVDEAAFVPHAAGAAVLGGSALEVDVRLLGGPSMPGLVLSRTPLGLATEAVEPAALVRARLLLEGHDPAVAHQAQGWLISRLEALVGRFPDLVLAPRVTGYVFGFELPTAAHRENLAAQLPLRGALVGPAPAHHPRSIVGRLGLTWTLAETDRLFDALRGALKWLEAHLDAHGEGPQPTADDLPTPTRAPRPAPTAITRVRVVEPDEADALLDAIVALEERVYEPARRDSREKLGLAFHDPGGVAVVAERLDGETWNVVGGALAAPLERIHGVPGCDDDPLRAEHVSIYSIGTTLDPACRGLGLGEKMKAAVVEGAAALRRRDGSPRFHWVCGRMRVGATDAMARINRRLGASEVRRLRNQYGGGAEASYYRLPVRGFVAKRTPSADPVILHRPERWLSTPPEDLVSVADAGLLFGPTVHGLEPGAERATPAALRTVEVLRAWAPSQPHVALARSRRGALHVAATLGGDLVGLQGDDLADLRARRIQHPADDLGGALDALRDARATVFVERVQARSGRVVPEAFFDALRDRKLRFVCVERATSGGRHATLPPEDALAVVWGEGALGVVHAREPLPLGAAGDELTLVRTGYLLRAARTWRLAGAVDESALDAALAPLEGEASIRGEGLYRVAETPRAPWLAAALRAYGFELRAHGDHLAFAPAFDLPEERFAELRSALKRVLR